MAYFPKKKRSMKKKRTTKRKVVSRSGRPTKALSKMVQRIISRNIENKVHQSFYEMPVYYVSSGADAMEFRGLFPITPYTATGSPPDTCIGITYGTSQKARIGNTIRTKRAILKGILFPRARDGDLNPEPRPLEVCLWIFKLKGFGVTGGLGDTLGGAEYALENNFLQDATATGSAEGLTGQLIDVMRPVNTDGIQILHKRVFKLGYSAVSASNQGNLGDNQGYANNDFKYNQKFSINVTKYLPKVIKYDDNDDMPSIRHTYVMIAPYNADGSNSNNSSLSPCICNWSLEYTYEDA